MQFRDILLEHDIPIAPDGHHHSRDGWIQIDCPWCGPGSSKFHMGFNTRGGYVNCWQCGPHRLTDTISQLTGWSVSKSRYELKLLDRDHERPLEKPTGKLEFPTGVGPLLLPHLRYLRHRHYDTKQLVSLWNLKGIGIHSFLSWRIFIPIMFNGKTVSWTTRSIDDGGTRYRSARASQEAYSHKDLLYGEDYCRHACVVHEGPFDVFRTGPGSVATCGVGYSQAQMLRISKYPVRVICFDNQPEAQVRARHLCDELEPFPGETINIRLDSKDAGSATDIEVAYLRTFLKR